VKTSLLSGYGQPSRRQALGGDAAGEANKRNDVRLKAKWLAQLAKMVCATSQNDVRSWQNDVRAISDVTDVLGKMMCALMCALVCALMCAPVAGVPVAQRISFSCRSRV